jgi:hypothetical protein
MLISPSVSFVVRSLPSRLVELEAELNMSKYFCSGQPMRVISPHPNTSPKSQRHQANLNDARGKQQSPSPRKMVSRNEPFI